MADTPLTPLLSFAMAGEIVLLLAGCVLLWRQRLSPTGRAGWRSTPPALTAWDVSLSDFLLFVFVIVIGAAIGSAAVGFMLTRTALPIDARLILGSAGMQLGMLIGATLLPLRIGRHPFAQVATPSAWRSGIATFLIALPVVTAINIAWVSLLTQFGVPTTSQDLVRIFRDNDSPALALLFTFFAVVVAPFAEELLFRGTIFRFLRTRIPRWLALTIPGVVFAALHINWVTFDGLASFAPLVTLAIVFSLAYERTGLIAVPIIAHALFNANTVLLLLAGVTN